MSMDAARAIARQIKTAGDRPVTADDVRRALLKAAADKELEARMTKEAFGRFGAGAFKAMSGTFRGAGRAGGAAVRGAGRAGGAVARNPIGQRALKTTGAIGATTLGGAHAYNDAQDTVGVTANPLTWGRTQAGRRLGMDQGPSHEDVFKRNLAGYSDASQGIQQEMDAAMAGGDLDKYKQLNDRFMAGDFAKDEGLDLVNGTGFDPRKWRMGGLNPLAASHGSTYQSNMMNAQKALQGQYDSAMKQSGPQAGDQDMLTQLQERLQSNDLLPSQASAMQRQVDMLQKRMAQPSGVENDAAKAIRSRMTGAGMRHVGAKPDAPQPGGVTPYSGWSLGSRPKIPGYLTGAAMMPNDFREQPAQTPWESIQGSGQPFQFQG